MDQNGNDPNAGAANAGNSGAADSGNQGGTPASSSTPDGQGGAAPASWEQEKQQMSDQIKALNKAVVEARRNSRNAGQVPNNDQGQTFDTPEGQYAAAIQIATSNLRTGLEQRISLYPELSTEDAQRIRMNPWAFASQELFFKGDWESALDEVEQHIADKVDALAANNGTPQPGTPATPASVNANPAQETPAAGGAPGTSEDEDPWTMPLDKLEAKARQQIAQKSQK